MKRTGERLKASREEQKLTISEVSLSTKINPRVLQAMEAGQLDKLPATSFLKGFIRSYAAFLKLNGDELLDLFSEELDEKKAQEEVLADPTEETPLPWYQSVPLLKDSSMTSKSLAAGGVVLLIVIILGIKNLVDKYEREGDVAAPPENIESLIHEGDGTPSSGDKLKTANKEPIPPSPKPESKPQPAVNPKPEAKPETTAEAKPRPAQPSEVKVSEESKSAEELVPRPETKPEPKPVAEVKEEDTAPASPQEIIIEALDQVEVTFRIDGGKLEKMLLKPDQIHTFKGRASVAIDLSDGGAVNVIHNGVDRGVPGDLGKPKKVKYP